MNPRCEVITWSLCVVGACPLLQRCCNKDMASLSLPGICKALGIIPGMGEECRSGGCGWWCIPLSPAIWDEEKEPTSSRLVWTTKRDFVSTITAAAATEHNNSSNFRAGDQTSRDVKRWALSAMPALHLHGFNTVVTLWPLQHLWVIGFSCTVFMKQIKGLYWSYNGLGTDGSRVRSTCSYAIMLLSLSRLLSSDWLYPQVRLFQVETEMTVTASSLHLPISSSGTQNDRKACVSDS